MIEKRNSTHARNHRKARQAHMKMVGKRRCVLHSAFEQLKGSALVLFFGFCGHSRLLPPKPEKKRVRIHFMKNTVRKVYTAKISAPYQLFFGSGPIFFCSVNRALVSHTLCFSNHPVLQLLEKKNLENVWTKSLICKCKVIRLKKRN